MEAHPAAMGGASGVVSRWMEQSKVRTGLHLRVGRALCARRLSQSSSFAALRINMGARTARPHQRRRVSRPRSQKVHPCMLPNRLTLVRSLRVIMTREYPGYSRPSRATERTARLATAFALGWGRALCAPANVDQPSAVPGVSQKACLPEWRLLNCDSSP